MLPSPRATASRSVVAAARFATLALLSVGTSFAQGFQRDEAADGGRQGAGLVSSHRLKSAVLGERREFRVAVPDGYETSSVGYPMLYVLDGRDNLDHTADSVKHLSDRETVPQMIVVAVHNTSREWDMTPPIWRWSTSVESVAARMRS